MAIILPPLPPKTRKETTVQSSFGMKTILLVDDDEVLRDLFSRALRKKGYLVVEADSGVDGFEKARKHLPDLILTDICMPGGDGETLLHNIRDDRQLKSSQVIVMSGMPDLLLPRTGTEEGADDFLTKPVTIKQLLSCVQVRFSIASLSCDADDQIEAPLTERLVCFHQGENNRSNVSAAMDDLEERKPSTMIDRYLSMKARLSDSGVAGDNHPWSTTV